MAKQSSDAIAAEQYFAYVTESIQMLVELTTRIDERVKNLIEKQEQIDEQIEKLINMQNTFTQRLTIIETQDIETVIEDLQNINKTLAVMDNLDASTAIDNLRKQYVDLEFQMKELESKHSKNDKFWEKMFDGIWKITIAVLGTYIVYKLGIQS